jgi:nitrite reductase/ring-hydroxylating ferredoxin subunit
VSPAFAFLGVSIIGTWGLASIGLIASGIIMLVAPGPAATDSSPVVGGIFMIIAGLVSLGLMQVVVTPLLGLDPPLPIKKLIPSSKLIRWASAGPLRDFPEGMPKETRVLSRRILIVRQGDTAHALSALCSHARLPLAGFPGSPIKAQEIKDNCVMCPFHGARFDVESGRVVRQSFDSQFNNDHPLLGRLQSKLLFWNKKAYEQQTYPVRIEDGNVMVALPKNPAR